MFERYWSWLALAMIFVLVLIPLLRGTFGLFGAVMDITLFIVIAIGVAYVVYLRQREGRGPSTENKGDLMMAARKNLEQQELSPEEFKRIKENIDD